MKNSTQITFAFQDPPDSGENPGVGVRIKSLKKAAGEVSKDQQEKEPVEAAEGVSGNEASVAYTAGWSESSTNRGTDRNDDGREDPQEAATQNNELISGSTIDGDKATSSEAGLDEPVFFESKRQFSDARDPRAMPSDEGMETGYIEPAGTMDDSTVHLSAELSENPLKAAKSTRGRKSLKTIDEGAELINIPPDEILFQKQYYAIGEVAEMFHVNQSLLRFWETEFDIIQPRKNRKGDRHFRPIDIKNLLLIHDLLRRRKLTIEGAKDFLKKNKRSPERFAMIQSLQKIKGFILEIKATL